MTVMLSSARPSHHAAALDSAFVPKCRSPLSLTLTSPPHSPLFPIAPSTPQPHLSASSYVPSPSYREKPGAPPVPLPWLWTCHLCRQTYPIGATRRCLEDGHRFCSGVPAVTSQGLPAMRDSSSRRKQADKKRGRACGSEFDYAGWMMYNKWRAQQAKRAPKNGNKGGCGHGKNCERDCSYPSECRWSRMEASQDQSSSSEQELPKYDIDADIEAEIERDRSNIPKTTFEELLGCTADEPDVCYESLFEDMDSSSDEEEADDDESSDGASSDSTDDDHAEGSSDLEHVDLDAEDPASSSSPTSNPLFYRRSYESDHPNAKRRFLCGERPTRRWRKGLW